jgi:hypothetical protein
MAKRFDNISKNNKNINALSNFFSNDDDGDRVGADPSVSEAKNAPSSVVTRRVEAEFVRQTLIMSAEDLDLVRNIVYTRRLEGKVNYTQKEALQEIIAAFRNSRTDIKERPEEVRADELKRSERIIKGKK